MFSLNFNKTIFISAFTLIFVVTSSHYSYLEAPEPSPNNQDVFEIQNPTAQAAFDKLASDDFSSRAQGIQMLSTLLQSPDQLSTDDKIHIQSTLSTLLTLDTVSSLPQPVYNHIQTLPLNAEQQAQLEAGQSLQGIPNLSEAELRHLGNYTLDLGKSLHTVINSPFLARSETGNSRTRVIAVGGGDDDQRTAAFIKKEREDIQQELERASREGDLPNYARLSDDQKQTLINTIFDRSAQVGYAIRQRIPIKPEYFDEEGILTPQAQALLETNIQQINPSRFVLEKPFDPYARFYPTQSMVSLNEYVRFTPTTLTQEEAQSLNSATERVRHLKNDSAQALLQTPPAPTDFLRDPGYLEYTFGRTLNHFLEETSGSLFQDLFENITREEGTTPVSEAKLSEYKKYIKETFQKIIDQSSVQHKTAYEALLPNIDGAQNIEQLADLVDQAQTNVERVYRDMADPFEATHQSAMLAHEQQLSIISQILSDHGQSINAQNSIKALERLNASFIDKHDPRYQEILELGLKNLHPSVKQRALLEIPEAFSKEDQVKKLSHFLNSLEEKDYAAEIKELCSSNTPSFSHTASSQLSSLLDSDGAEGQFKSNNTDVARTMGKALKGFKNAYQHSDIKCARAEQTAQALEKNIDDTFVDVLIPHKRAVKVPDCVLPGGEETVGDTEAVCPSTFGTTPIDELNQNVHSLVKFEKAKGKSKDQIRSDYLKALRKKMVDGLTQSLLMASHYVSQDQLDSGIAALKSLQACDMSSQAAVDQLTAKKSQPPSQYTDFTSQKLDHFLRTLMNVNAQGHVQPSEIINQFRQYASRQSQIDPDDPSEPYNKQYYYSRTLSDKVRAHRQQNWAEDQAIRETISSGPYGFLLDMSLRGGSDRSDLETNFYGQLIGFHQQALDGKLKIQEVSPNPRFSFTEPTHSRGNLDFSVNFSDYNGLKNQLQTQFNRQFNSALHEMSRYCVQMACQALDGKYSPSGYDEFVRATKESSPLLKITGIPWLAQTSADVARSCFADESPEANRDRTAAVLLLMNNPNLRKAFLDEHPEYAEIDCDIQSDIKNLSYPFKAFRTVVGISDMVVGMGATIAATIATLPAGGIGGVIVGGAVGAAYTVDAWDKWNEASAALEEAQDVMYAHGTESSELKAPGAMDQLIRAHASVDDAARNFYISAGFTALDIGLGIGMVGRSINRTRQLARLTQELKTPHGQKLLALFAKNPKNQALIARAGSVEKAFMISRLGESPLEVLRAGRAQAGSWGAYFGQQLRENSAALATAIKNKFRPPKMSPQELAMRRAARGTAGEFVPLQEALPKATEAAEEASKRFERVTQSINRSRAQRNLPPLTVEEVQRVFAERYQRKLGRQGLVFMDTPADLGVSPSRSQGIVFDHHGPFFDPTRPERNTTMQVLDFIEECLSGPGTPAQKMADLKRIFRRVSTDNLGDGGWAVWISQHLDEVAANPALRDKIRLATFYEDFALFGGTRFEQQATQAMKEAKELQDAILNGYDTLLEKYGVSGGDRFHMLPPQKQQELMREAQALIDDVLKNSESRAQGARAFTGMQTQASKAVNAAHEAMVADIKTNLMRQGKTAEEAERIVTRLKGHVYVFDGGKISSSEFGTFSAWSAPAREHELPLQLNIRTLPDGRTSFILANPQGRAMSVSSLKPIGEKIRAAHLRNFTAKTRQTLSAQGLSGAELEAALQKAVAEETAAVSKEGGRDALQFSFRGVDVSPEEMAEILADELSPVRTPTRVPSTHVPTGPPLAAPKPPPVPETTGSVATLAPPRPPAPKRSPIALPAVLNKPVAIVDVGSSTAKIYVVKPDGTIFERHYNIGLGKSLGQSGEISEEAFQSLVTALKKIEKDLLDNGVPASHVRTLATAGIRDAKNKAAVLERLKEAGFPLEVIDGHQESELVYRAVMHNQAPGERGAIVIEVGGGSTEVIVGEGATRIQRDTTQTMSIGSGSIGIEDPFHPQHIASARTRARAIAQQHLNPSVIAAGRERPAVLASNTVYQTLRDVHFERTGEDLFKSGLNREVIQYYLSPEGLELLKQATRKAAFSNRVNALHNLPSKLLILDEIGAQMGIQNFKFGSSGGMKVGAVFNLVEGRVKVRMGAFADQLATQYRENLPAARQQIQNLFPEETFGTVSLRNKSSASAAAKLYRKAMGGKTITNLREAAANVSDGIGGRLIVREPTPARMNQVTDQIIQGIERGEIKVTKIENYRGPNGIPYLDDASIERIQRAMHQKGIEVEVVSGVEAVRPSGYTTAQMNIVFKSGVTGEFQIRGPIIHDLAEVEHIVYDLRQGKGLLPPYDVPQLREVENVFTSLPRRQQEEYMLYLREQYQNARRREMGDTLFDPPQLPESIRQHKVLELEEIKRRMPQPHSWLHKKYWPPRHYIHTHHTYEPSYAYAA